MQTLFKISTHRGNGEEPIRNLVISQLSALEQDLVCFGFKNLFTFNY